MGLEMAKTILHEEMPATFPELVQGFIKPRKKSKSKAKNLNERVREILTEKYPLLSPDILNAQRILRQKADSDLLDLLKSQVQRSYDSMSHLKELDWVGWVPPEKIKLNIPLFAYSTSDSWKSKGLVYYEFPYSDKFHINLKSSKNNLIEINFRGKDADGNKRRMLGLLSAHNTYHEVEIRGKLVFHKEVDIKAETPVTPSSIVECVPNAMSDYYSAYIEALTGLNKKERGIPQPQIGILWIPSPESVKVKIDIPHKYKDPALVLEVGRDKYIIGLWDSKKEEPIESIIREWTSGAFKGVKYDPRKKGK